MITVKDVYAAYPDRATLPVALSQARFLSDVELSAHNEHLGDTLFLFICRELCGEDVDPIEANWRLEDAIYSLREVRKKLCPVAVLDARLLYMLAAHIGEIYKAEASPYEEAVELPTLSRSSDTFKLSKSRDGQFYREMPNSGERINLGNVCGARQAYIEFVMATVHESGN